MRGEIRAHQGRHSEAIEDFDRAVSFGPTISKSYYLRGRARLATEDYNGAITDCTKAIELLPEGAMGYYYRGAVWGVKQSWKDALADFRKIQGFPVTGDLQDYAAVNVWICRARSGEIAEATAEIKGYLARKPEDAITTPILRACRFLAGETSEKDYADWVAAEPSKVSAEDQCEAYLYIGNKRLATGDKAGAEQSFEKSVKTGVRSCSQYHAATQALLVLRAR